MDDAAFGQIIDLGHETARIEFKSGGRRDDGHAFAVVARAMMAMANTRGGGFVILGVAEREDKSLDPAGMQEVDVQTWMDFDAFSARLGSFCEPHITFDAQVQSYQNRAFVVISVQEFADQPVICTKRHESQADAARGRGRAEIVLTVGTLYVRSGRKPQSAPVATYAEMRQLVDLATEKGLARYAQLKRLEGGSGPSAVSVAYDRELEGLL